MHGQFHRRRNVETSNRGRDQTCRDPSAPEQFIIEMLAELRRRKLSITEMFEASCLTCAVPMRDKAFCTVSTVAPRL